MTNQHILQLIQLQGEFKVLLLQRGFPQWVAHDIAGELLDVVARSPVASADHQEAYNETPRGGTPFELFPDDTVEAESPRLAWMKKHGIRTAENKLKGIALERTWSAWFAKFEYEYGVHYGATEDEALAALARSCEIKLWNEEGA